MAADAPPPIYTLPLFPLGSVLFPQFLLQLHVFEERYRAMINSCIEANQPFGVVLIREGSEVGAPATPHDVGCVARILEVNRLDDGRMHLMAVGDKRFRLLDYMEGDLPYLIGRVEEVEDAEDPDVDLAPLMTDVADAFMAYLELLAARAHLEMPDVELPDDPLLLAFYVASVAMFSPEDRQTFLEMTDTRARLQLELRWLRAQALEMQDNPPTDVVSSEAEVVVARPLDRDSDYWQQFRVESIN